MSRTVRYLALEDAYFFLNQLRGLPNVPNTAALRGRYIRSSMLLSWIAVEEALEFVISERQLRNASDFPHSAKLIQLIEHVAATNGRVLGSFALIRARSLRNDVAHPRTEAVLNAAATERNCSEVFDTCRSAIEAISPVRVSLGNVT